jgi:putative N6-adenine-specific DNA methylase
VTKRCEQLFAIVAPGLEEVCATELTGLSFSDVRVVPGGVEFSGGLREIYLANLWLRSGSRVLVRFGEIRCRDFPTLYRKALRLPWGRYLKVGTRIKVRAVSHRSRLQHTGRIAETLQEAVDRALGGTAEGTAVAEQLLFVRFEDDCCHLSMDSSGELLHRRGYREDVGAAPMRETLAAGILQLLGWDGTRPLVDPMCGSGTIPIEAALLAGRCPPGSARSFSFMNWPGYRAGLWQALLQESARQTMEPGPLIAGSDCDGQVLAAARRNAERAGVGERLVLRQADLADLTAFDGQGLVLCNPPYGARLGCDQDLIPLYRSLGHTCKTVFGGWRIALVCLDPRLAAATGLSLRKRAMLNNGGLRVSLLEGNL